MIFEFEFTDMPVKKKYIEKNIKKFRPIFLTFFFHLSIFPITFEIQFTHFLREEKKEEKRIILK
jgi:hypothetical protein